MFKITPLGFTTLPPFLLLNGTLDAVNSIARPFYHLTEENQTHRAVLEQGSLLSRHPGTDTSVSSHADAAVQLKCCSVDSGQYSMSILCL